MVPRGELLVLRCDHCGYLNHPPDVSCARCGAVGFEPVRVSGRGTIYSFTVVRQAFSPVFVAEVPYVISMVELDEQPGLVMIANIVESSPDALEIGMPVEVTFEDRGEYVLPQFRLASPVGNG